MYYDFLSTPIFCGSHPDFTGYAISTLFLVVLFGTKWRSYGHKYYMKWVLQ